MNRAQAVYEQSNDAQRAVLVGLNKSPDAVMRRRFGSAYDKYRQAWDRSGRFESIPDWPLHLDVDTNYTCNLNCVMCPLGTPGFPIDYQKKWLDFDLYRGVLTEGARRGLASVRIGLTGEPLLRPDIPDFIRLARDLGLIDIMLITNGVLLTWDMGRELIEAGLTRLMVSLDAVRPETYRRIRRGGQLERTVGNVLNFLDLRREMGRDLPLVRVSFIRMSFNEDEKNDFENFWQDRADYFSFQEYANILESPDTDFFPSRPKKAERFRCPDPWQRLSLFVNGDLFPCCSDFGRLAPLGNARQTTVARLWHSSEAHRLRQLHQRGDWSADPICRRCAASSTAATPVANESGQG